MLITDTIPQGLTFPCEATGIEKLATLYKKPKRTLQRAFRKIGIHELIGKKRGCDYTPLQLLVIFHFYFPPVKYYKSFLWLEQNGYLDALLKRYDLNIIKNKRQ
jgi:hypothetical protein